ncbi:MAG: DUF2933 domain-containing protein [Ignavibacteriae bacterium]|nr:DUF2933 domain-containing protein [Ignavibacteriota bacterium]NOG99790.1 DUF2933 domain-containing protein [Ignavibacteriota bacterium]
MEWLAENWFWVLVLILFVVMHIFGHGGHWKHSDDKNEDKNRKNHNPDSGHGHH